MDYPTWNLTAHARHTSDFAAHGPTIAPPLCCDWCEARIQLYGVSTRRPPCLPDVSSSSRLRGREEVRETRHRLYRRLHII